MINNCDRSLSHLFVVERETPENRDSTNIIVLKFNLRIDIILVPAFIEIICFWKRAKWLFKILTTFFKILAWLPLLSTYMIPCRMHPTATSAPEGWVMASHAIFVSVAKWIHCVTMYIEDFVSSSYVIFIWCMFFGYMHNDRSWDLIRILSSAACVSRLKMQPIGWTGWTRSPGWLLSYGTNMCQIR